MGPYHAKIIPRTDCGDGPTPTQGTELHVRTESGEYFNLPGVTGIRIECEPENVWRATASFLPCFTSPVIVSLMLDTETLVADISVAMYLKKVFEHTEFVVWVRPTGIFDGFSERHEIAVLPRGLPPEKQNGEGGWEIH